MKKTFNRLLAATVAIPVALGQILAITANAANDRVTNVTTTDLLYINPEKDFPVDEVTADTTAFSFDQVSTWNTYVKEQLDKAADKELTIDAKAIVGSLNPANYYASLIKDIVEASANPTATVQGNTVTITGEANFAAYLVPELEEKFAGMEGYDDVTIDTSVLEGITYTATLTADFDNKSAKADLIFTAGGKDYTVGTATDFLQVVYDDLAGQVDKAVEDKVAALVEEYEEYGLDADEALAQANADVEDDKAALKETLDKLSNKIDALNKKLDAAKTVSFAEKTYTNADDALAAAKNYAVNNGLQSAAELPGTVNEYVAKYGNAFNTAVDSFNTSLTDADVAVQIAISADDVASVLNGATEITASADNGSVTVVLTVADEEAADVEAYVEDQVAALDINKTVKSVTSEKVITITTNAATAEATLDIVRTVDVELEDVDSTETTPVATETTPTETTPTGTDTDVPGSETTATSESGEVPGSDTTATSESGEVPGSDTTATTESSENPGSVTTTESTPVATGTDISTDSSNSGEGGTTTESTETTPTGTQPIANVKEVAVELLDVNASNGVYFSHEESYNVADLISSITLTLDDEDGTLVEVAPEDFAAYIGFKTTPGEDYASAAEDGYFYGEIDLTYIPNEDVEVPAHPTVAVALKGDTNLNGSVDQFDAYWTLLYNSQKSAGNDAYTFTTKDDTSADVDVLLEKLVYYVSDIVGESKAGTDIDADNKITQFDAYFILMYNSWVSVGVEPTWDDVINGTVSAE